MVPEEGFVYGSVPVREEGRKGREMPRWNVIVIVIVNVNVGESESVGGGRYRVLSTVLFLSLCTVH